MQQQSDSVPSVRLMLGGDLMLGRLVGDAIAQFGPGYPLAPVAGLLRQADVSIVNLECALTASRATWPGAPKAFYFGAPPQAIAALTGAGIDLVSLANNHTLDYGIKGLQETLCLLHTHGIKHAGAGDNLEQALAPALLTARHGITLGMAAFCDHQDDFAAQAHRPGIAWLDLEDEAGAVKAFERALAPLRRAGVDWPVLSLHWGPNMVLQPSTRFRRLAHAALDMGWKILFGHSAHVFQGVEIYRGCPIVYAAGDLVDDYYVDPEFRNDHQLLFELELDKARLRHIRLIPIFIERCQAQPAGQRQAEFILARMDALCGQLGTRLRREDGEVFLEPGP